MSQVQRKGPWIQERMLGSGGFGAVHLWRNQETDERIALKKCRLESEMSSKHKQRWELEVQIMQRLKHDNVIACHVVPDPLDVSPQELPLLAMEYCSGGDLRKILNKPQNCCGLREYYIRYLVKDIAAAIEYLHAKRIIHRDVKPENIVLKPVDERTVYKLIDLGYAKELDQSSVCTSFVGTLQYLAPELFASQKYTCTVDHWSFGTVVFECITGYRPFLPNDKPIRWHHEIMRKSHDDICALEDANGVVKFSKTVTTRTNLCRSMQTYLEQWLRLMLRWDPKTRGGGLAKDRPTCFTMLDNILSMKIIYILHVSANELLTYPVVEQHTMLDVHRRIEEETQIPIQDQDIILATGMCPEHNKLASQCWLEPSEDDFVVFLYQRGGEDFSPSSSHTLKKKSMPPAVQAIVKDQKTMIPFTEQKKAWAESVHYVEQQFREFRRMVLSQRAAMLSLLRADSLFVKRKNQMINDQDKLIAQVQYFQASMDHDMMFYHDQANNGGVSSESMYSKWQKMAEIVANFKLLKEKVSELEQQAVVVQTKIVELQRSPFARSKQDDTLEDLAKQAGNVYQKFRETARENRNALQDQKPMVTVVVKCIVFRDKKLPDLFAHLSKIGACKQDIYQLQPQVEGCLKEIQQAADKLISFQKQRQTAVWKLVEVALRQGQTQQKPLSSETVDLGGVSRPEVRGAAMSRSESGVNNNMSQSLMQSIMTTGSALESLRVVEDAKETNKMFEETVNSLIHEHDEFTSMMTSFGSLPNKPS